MSNANGGFVSVLLTHLFFVFLVCFLYGWGYLNAQDGAISVKFWLRVEQFKHQGRERGSSGTIGPWAQGPLGRGVEHFLGRGYSLSWIGQLPFVFAWASPNVVRYLGERLAHVLMENYSNRPRGFYTVAHKIQKFILFWQLLEFLVSQKRQRISAHKQYQK